MQKKKNSQFKRESVISYTHVRTEVRHEVHVRIEVHNYVDEGLSEAKLVQKIADMQRDFQTTLEQYVKHPKACSSFLENSGHRAVLIHKIIDMEGELQRRITALDQYLNIPTTVNVEKTLDVVKECMDPSCGSNNHVKHGVNKSIDTSCGSDVKAKNVINESMDVDHDPKNLEDLFEEEELVAVDVLMEMIDFDISKDGQLPTQCIKNAIQGCDDVKLCNQRLLILKHKM
nr:hypothetical protein [Tanacetum cinerariifolium]GEZ76731.1 hypothetical protein [Tanacetum cinerariifolium]